MAQRATSSANTDPDGPCGEEVCIDKGELTDRPWTVGDNVNLAVGQGDLQADPLQMAVAYAAIANGGTVVTPARRPAGRGPATGRVIQEIEPAPRREVDIDPRLAPDDPRRPPRRRDGARRHLLSGLRRLPGRDRRQDRYRRAPGQADQSWYIALAPYPDPKYVVAVTIESGGFGVDTAAPAAREILNQLLHVKASKIDDVEARRRRAAYE